MKIIVRDEVLEQCSIGYKLLQINICENNLKSSKDFSIGFVAEGALRNLTKKALLPKKAKDGFMKVLSNVSKLSLTNWKKDAHWTQQWCTMLWFSTQQLLWTAESHLWWKS